MVKVGLNIKNGSKVFKPKPGDVIIFDGKDWYITTKDDIFKEYQDKVNAKLREVDIKLQETENFKTEISEQMVELGETIRKFINLQGDK